MDFPHSLWDLIRRAGQFWAFSVVGVVLGILAAMERIFSPVPPEWRWVVDVLNLVWPWIFFGGIPIAVVAAYHSLWTELRKRDAAPGTVKFEYKRTPTGHESISSENLPTEQFHDMMGRLRPFETSIGIDPTSQSAGTAVPTSRTEDQSLPGTGRSSGGAA